MSSNKKRGRPGPAFTIGIPMVLAAFAGSWGYQYFKEARKTEAPKDAAEQKQAHPVTLKVAADPWSGYSTFRGEPRLAQALAKDAITLQYLDEERFYDQNERMRALGAGEIDLALTTLDAFLQHGAKHRSEAGYPGVILFGIDESAGGDAIFLNKDKKSFDDVQPGEKVCFAAGTPSEHLWDFASLSFVGLGDDVAQSNGVVAKDCWEKLERGEVQIAVLWQPYTALAVKAGYPKVFATGGQADDVILDIAVVNRETLRRERPALVQLASAYFKTIDGYQKQTAEHAAFLTKDCGPDCGGDAALGSAVLEGIDFLTLEENSCLWFGQCDSPSKLEPRVGKTGSLLVAKGKLEASVLPEPKSIVDASLLAELKQERLAASKLLADVSGPETVVEASFKLTDRVYAYTVPGAEGVGAVGTLQLPNVFFQEGSYFLGDEGKATVASIAESLRSFPSLCVRIAGHTNSNGDPTANRQLSKFRAMAIAAELTNIDPKVFPSTRFDVRGFGSDQPVLVDGKEDGKASRRTEFTLVNCAGSD